MATPQDVHKALAFLLNGMVERMAKRNINQHRIPLLQLLGPNTARIYGPLITSNNNISRELRQRFASIIEYEVKAYPCPRLIPDGGTYYVEFYDASNADEVEFTRDQRFGTSEYMHRNFRTAYDSIAKRGRNFEWDMLREMIDTTIPPVRVGYIASSLIGVQDPAPTVREPTGINVSEQLQDLMRVFDGATRFYLDSASVPEYESEGVDRDTRHEGWVKDGRPQLLLNVGHTEHNNHTVIFFENITHGSGLHVMAVFAGSIGDVTGTSEPELCFRVQGRGVPVEVQVPGDEQYASLIMVPQHTDQCIKPIWYTRKN